MWDSGEPLEGGGWGCLRRPARGGWGCAMPAAACAGAVGVRVARFVRWVGRGRAGGCPSSERRGIGWLRGCGALTRQPLRADTPRHAPSSPYAALPANAPGTPPRRTRLSPPSLRVPLLAVRGSPRHRSGYPSSPYAALPAIAPGTPPRRTRLSPPSLRVPLLAVRGSPRQRPASPAPPYAAPPPSLRAVVPLGRHGWALRHPATPGRAPPCARTHPGHRVRRRARDPHRPRVPANLGSPHPLPSPKPPPGDRVNRSGGLVR